MNKANRLDPHLLAKLRLLLAIHREYNKQHPECPSLLSDAHVEAQFWADEDALLNTGRLHLSPPPATPVSQPATFRVWPTSWDWSGGRQDLQPTRAPAPSLFSLQPTFAEGYASPRTEKLRLMAEQNGLLRELLEFQRSELASTVKRMREHQDEVNAKLQTLIASLQEGFNNRIQSLVTAIESTKPSAEK